MPKKTPSAPKKRRTVYTGPGVLPSRKGGGQQRLFAFSYADLAAAFGVSAGAVRMAVFEHRLDPTNLSSICIYWHRQQQRWEKKSAHMVAAEPKKAPIAEPTGCGTFGLPPQEDLESLLNNGDEWTTGDGE